MPSLKLCILNAAMQNCSPEPKGINGMSTEMKSINSKRKTQSRREAQESRPIVLARARGCCELCDTYSPFLLECHHIVPVPKGGHGGEENLVALCPTCHAIITKLRCSAIDNPHFHNWIRDNYGEMNYEKFGHLLQEQWHKDQRRRLGRMGQ